MCLIIALGLTLANAGPLHADSVSGATPSDKPESGQSTAKPPSVAGQYSRTVHIEMQQLSFDQSSIFVTAGETIRFVVRNSSKLPHDFTLGEPQDQRARRALLRGIVDKIPPGQGAAVNWPDAANAIVVGPGQFKEIVWQFDRSGEIQFGCNVPLHYQAGMKGEFNIAHKQAPAKTVGPTDQHPPVFVGTPRASGLRQAVSSAPDDVAAIATPIPRARPAALRRKARLKRRLIRGPRPSAVNYNINTRVYLNDYAKGGSGSLGRSSHGIVVNGGGSSGGGY